MPRWQLLSATIAQLLALGTAQAGDIAVLSAADVVADDGACTLREAIENANSDSQNGRTSPGECAAGGGSDIIDVVVGSGGPPQTITLLLGEMVISSSMQIIGPGRDQLTIDADGLSRHFSIDDGDTAQSTVSISDLRLFNGRSNTSITPNSDGGSLYNRENLSLSRLTIEGNTASDGSNGGGLHCQSSQPLQILLDDVRLLDNQAQFGGGAVLRLGNGGLIEIRNSQVSNNRALSSGLSASGGGLAVRALNGAEVRISDSTISGNTVSGNGVSVCTPCQGAGFDMDADSGSALTLERLLVSDNVLGTGTQDSTRGAASG